MRAALFALFRRASRRLAPFQETLKSVPGVPWLYHHVYRRLNPGGLVQVRTGDATLWVSARDDGVGRPLLLHGVFEPQETALVRRLLRPGMHVVDVGANLGYYTVLCAQRVGPAGRVTALEPDPENLELLARNVRANQLANVTVHAVAASHRAGTERLFTDATNAGNSSLTRGNIPHFSGREVPVTTTTLDQLLAGLPPVDLLKVDVQGHEDAVLAGATRLLAQPGLHVLLEVWPRGLELAGAHAVTLLQRLVDAGYTLAEVGGSVLRTPADAVERCRARPDGFINVHAYRDHCSTQ